MTRIAVLSLKGGVGKTTVTLGLAEQARRDGLRVLVVDLDPQANASQTLLHHHPQLTVNDALVDGRQGIAEMAIVPSDWGAGLDLLAAEPALEHRNRDQDAAIGARLRTVLSGATARYGLVLIDCPPAMGTLTRNALAAADRAVVVTEPSFHALRGAEEALASVRVARDASNLGLDLAGIIVNRYRAGLKEHEHRMAELTQAYGDLVLRPLLPERIAVARATGAGVAVQSLPGSGARDMGARYRALLQTLVPQAGRQNRRKK